MTISPLPVLAAMMAALVLAGAAPVPAAPSGEPAELQPAKTAQFFERNGRSDDRSRRRDRRIEKFRAPPPNRDDETNIERRQPRQRQEQDRALDAVRRGEVLPLGNIIRSAQSACPGTFLDASLQRRGNSLAYRVALLRPSGRRVTLLVDAASGAVIGGRCR